MSSFLCITSNVGSLFEHSEKMLSNWINSIAEKVKLSEPEIFILHLQEIGGREFASGGTDLFEGFVACLKKNSILSKFSRLLCFFDSKIEISTFTALATIVFFSDEVIKDVQVFDFEINEFNLLENIDPSLSPEKSIAKFAQTKSFPRNFFPELQATWTRKGYIHTLIQCKGERLGFVNVHLFHDESNLVQLEASRSVYSKNRANALEYVMKNIDYTNKSINNDEQHVVLFGDFNFRTDTYSLLNKLSENLTRQNKFDDNGEIDRVLYFQDGISKPVIDIQHKHFFSSIFGLQFEGGDITSNRSVFDTHFKLDKFDCELDWYNENFGSERSTTTMQLSEYPKRFLPSYRMIDEGENPNMYNRKRCP
eukprot:Pgem_evm1s19261